MLMGFLIVAIVAAAAGAGAGWVLSARNNTKLMEDRDQHVWNLESKVDRLKSKLATVELHKEMLPGEGPFRKTTEEALASADAAPRLAENAEVVAAKAAVSAKVAHAEAEAGRKVAVAQMELEKAKQKADHALRVVKAQGDAERQRLETSVAAEVAHAEAEAKRKAAEAHAEAARKTALADMEVEKARLKNEHDAAVLQARFEAELQKLRTELGHESSRHELALEKEKQDSLQRRMQLRALRQELDGILTLAPLNQETALERLAQRVGSLTGRLEKAVQTSSAPAPTMDGEEVGEEQLGSFIVATLEAELDVAATALKTLEKMTRDEE